MRLAILQMDVKIGEPGENFEKALAMMEKAIENRPDLIILPEMWNTGYDLKRGTEIADRDGKKAREMFAAFAENHQVTIVGGSILYCDSGTGRLTNTSLVFNQLGREILRYDKIHLFRLMDEDQYLWAGNQFGVFKWEDVQIGLMICYDLRFPQLSRKLVHKGARVLINVAQWPIVRVDHWRTLLIARAIENQSFVIAVNRCGTSGDTEFPGHSMVIDPFGQVMLEGDSNERIYHVEIDTSKVDDARKMVPVFDDERLDLY